MYEIYSKRNENTDHSCANPKDLPIKPRNVHRWRSYTAQRLTEKCVLPVYAKLYLICVQYNYLKHIKIKSKTTMSLKGYWIVSIPDKALVQRQWSCNLKGDKVIVFYAIMQNIYVIHIYSLWNTKSLKQIYFGSPEHLSSISIFHGETLLVITSYRDFISSEQRKLRAA